MGKTRTFLLILIVQLGSFVPRLSGASTDLPCTGTEISGLENILQDGLVLILGEIHGTAEVPRFLADIACLALTADYEVTIGLEIPREEQAAIEAYLESDRSMSAKKRLVNGRFWQFEDGRSSQAMLTLIEEVHKLEEAGSPVSMVLLDEISPENRDAAMAKHLVETVRASPEQVFLVVVGNLHNRMIRGALWDPNDSTWEPMGHMVSRELSDHRIISLNVKTGDGTAWMCADSCGVSPINGRSDGTPSKIVVQSTKENVPYHGFYYIEHPTASYPVTHILDGHSSDAHDQQ